MFQHRHYKAIASILADSRDSLTGKSNATFAMDEAINDIEDRLVKLFKGDNAGFSEDRFRKAASRSPDMHGKDKR